MFGRTSNNNIFSRTNNTNTNNTGGGTNIFNKSNNTNTNTNTSYGNNNNNTNNYSNRNISRLGSYRVDGYSNNQMPRVLQEINYKWKTSQLNPISIVARPQTMHLSLTQLRIQDYYLIRMNKLQREQQRLAKDAMQKKVMNSEMMNSHVVANLKEPFTFGQGEISLDVLKQMNKNRVIWAGPNTNNNTNNTNNSSIYGNNNNSKNIFGVNNNNNNNNTNNSSTNNIFNRNVNNNTNTSSIFNGGNNNNNSNNNNMFNSNTNNRTSNIFANNNGNNNNNNNMNTSNNNGTNIFNSSNNNNNGNNNNIFNRNTNNNTNTNTNNGNIFSNNNNNNGTNNIFNKNNTNNNNNNNIFNSNANRSSGNNIFANGNNNNGNNNNNNNNNGGNNIFNNNNNNNRGNNIFSNSNTNNNNSNGYNNNNNFNNNINNPQFAIYKVLQTNAVVMQACLDTNKLINQTLTNNTSSSYYHNKLLPATNPYTNNVSSYFNNTNTLLPSTSNILSSSNNLSPFNTLQQQRLNNNTQGFMVDRKKTLLASMFTQPVKQQEDQYYSYDQIQLKQKHKYPFNNQPMIITKNSHIIKPQHNNFYQNTIKPQLQKRSRLFANNNYNNNNYNNNNNNNQNNNMSNNFNNNMTNAFNSNMISKILPNNNNNNNNQHFHSTESMFMQQSFINNTNNNNNNNNNRLNKRSSQQPPSLLSKRPKQTNSNSFSNNDPQSMNLNNFNNSIKHYQNNNSKLFNNNNINQTIMYICQLTFSQQKQKIHKQRFQKPIIRKSFISVSQHITNIQQWYQQQLINYNKDYHILKVQINDIDPDQITANIVLTKVNLPQGCFFKPRQFKGFDIQGFQITNQYGTIKWLGKVNIKGVDFSKEITLDRNTVSCSAPQLDKQCLVTFNNLPEQIVNMKEDQAKRVLEYYFQTTTKGSVKLEFISVSPPEYRIRVKNFFEQNINN